MCLNFRPFLFRRRIRHFFALYAACRSGQERITNHPSVLLVSLISVGRNNYILRLTERCDATHPEGTFCARITHATEGSSIPPRERFVMPYWLFVPRQWLFFLPSLCAQRVKKVNTVIL